MRDHFSEPCKDDPRYHREIMDLASTDERDYWLKIIPDPMPATRKIEIRWLGELRLSISTVPLALADVAAKTNDFADLATRELKWLAEAHGVDSKHDDSAKDEGRSVLLSTLLDAATAPAKQPTKEEAEQLVVPEHVRKWSEPDIDTKSAELGVQAQFPNWKKMSRAKKNEAVARALASKDQLVEV
jgi:hypothetical protein